MQRLGGWHRPPESNRPSASLLLLCNMTKVAFGKTDHTHVLHQALRFAAGSVCRSLMIQYSLTVYPH